MNNQIPTAEEFIAKKANSFDTQMRRDTYYKDTVENLCVEFAKLHVKAALKAAAENAEAIEGWNSGLAGSAASVDTDSILNSYSEDLIK